MAEKPKKGQVKDDPQKVLKVLTEIANECVRLYDQGEKINLHKVFLSRFHNPQCYLASRRLKVRLHQSINSRECRRSWTFLRPSQKTINRSFILC